MVVIQNGVDWQTQSQYCLTHIEYVKGMVSDIVGRNIFIFI